MTDPFDPIHLFEHAAFDDAYDALRQSRLYAFRYQAEHPKYQAFCKNVRGKVSAELLETGLARPLEAAAQNNPHYSLFLTPKGREQLLPLLISEAVALGFNAFDDRMGECHTPTGRWDIKGFTKRTT